MAECKEETHSTNLTVKCQNQPSCSWGCICNINLSFWCFRDDCVPYVKNPSHYTEYSHIRTIPGLCPEIASFDQCCLGVNQHYLQHKSLMAHRNPHVISMLRTSAFARYTRKIEQIMNEIGSGFIIPGLLDIIISYSHHC
jgi:hypothetical protein